MFGLRLFQNNTICRLPHFKIHKNTTFKNDVVFSDLLSTLVSPRRNNIGFGAHGHVRKSRNHRNERPEGSHISRWKSYKIKMEQNNTTELLSISFPQIYHTNGTTIGNNVKHAGFSGFFRILYSGRNKPHKGGGLRPPPQRGRGLRPPPLCGFPLWLCRYVAMWLCGYVAM